MMWVNDGCGMYSFLFSTHLATLLGLHKTVPSQRFQPLRPKMSENLVQNV